MTLYRFLSQFHILVVVKQKIDAIELMIFRFFQIIKRSLTLSKPSNNATAYHFAIVCVKRPIYVNLAIKNINSLHFYNSSHLVTLYVDTQCKKAYQSMRSKIDYPKNVRIRLINVSGEVPWQILKVRTLLQASRAGQILTDADGIWRKDPTIDPSKVTFLVQAYPFTKNKFEMKLLKVITKNEKIVSYIHYVTGFVSLPRNLLTKKLENDCIKYTQRIIDVSPRLSVSHETSEGLKRLAEEIGLSIAIQHNIPNEKITTLKRKDGPGDKYILQSMYYGCTNKIIE